MGILSDRIQWSVDACCQGWIWGATSSGDCQHIVWTGVTDAEFTSVKGWGLESKHATTLVYYVMLGMGPFLMQYRNMTKGMQTYHSPRSWGNCRHPWCFLCHRSHTRAEEYSLTMQTTWFWLGVGLNRDFWIENWLLLLILAFLWVGVGPNKFMYSSEIQLEELLTKCLDFLWWYTHDSLSV